MNSKIKTERKQIITYEDEFITTDGEKFSDAEKAHDWQESLDGNRKACTNYRCISGYINKLETIVDPDYPPNLPDSGWVTKEVTRKHKCTTCGGKGYLELKWS